MFSLHSVMHAELHGPAPLSILACEIRLRGLHSKTAGKM